MIFILKYFILSSLNLNTSHDKRLRQRLKKKTCLFGMAGVLSSKILSSVLLKKKSIL